MSTTATIEPRTRIVGANHSESQISANPWNEPRIVKGGAGGGLFVRDPLQADGWGLIDAGPAGSVLMAGGPTAMPSWTTSPTFGPIAGTSLVLTNTIGAVSTDGLALVNPTAAAAGAQQWSPRLRFRGSGWKTNATAGAQSIEFIEEIKPIQSTAAPWGLLTTSASLNGGAYAGRLEIDSRGPVRAIGGDLQVLGTGWVDCVSGTGLHMFAPVDNGTFQIQSWSFGACSAVTDLRLQPSFGKLQLCVSSNIVSVGGAYTAGNPGFRANGATLEFRLGDDSAYAAIKALSASFGTNPAGADAIRIANTAFITARNNANTGDVRLLSVTSSDRVQLGDFNSNLILAASASITTQGSFLPNDDNARDFGSSSARYRSGYFGTAVMLGTNPATTGEIRLPNNSNIYFRNNTNSGDTRAFQFGADNQVYVHTHFRPGTDANYNLGDPVIRWVGGYFSNLVAIGTAPATTGAIRLPNAGVIRARWGGNNGDMDLLSLDASNQLLLGDAINLGTIKLLAATVRLSGAIDGVTAIAVGPTPATTGAIRLSNNTYVYGRNAANTADLPVVGITSTDLITLGNSTSASVVSYSGDANTDLGTANYRWRTGYFATALILGNTPATTGAIRMGNNAGISGRDAANTQDIQMIAVGPVLAGFTAGYNVLISSGGNATAFGGAILLKNNYAIAFVNAASNAQVGSLTFDTSNVLHLGDTGSGGNLAGVRFDTGTGAFTFTHQSSPTAFLVAFGGLTSASPALKRSGAELQVKLADDSAFANFRAQAFLPGANNNGDLGSPTFKFANGYIYTQLSIGTATAAGSGAINLAAGGGPTGIWVRNNGNTADLGMLRPGLFNNGGVADAIQLGGAGVTGISLNVASGNILFAGAGVYQFGGTTSSFPALKASAANLQVRFADDSAYSSLFAASVYIINGGFLSSASWGDLSFWADGKITLRNGAGTGFGMLQFGGTTSAFPAFRRTLTQLDVRLADDSAFTSLKAALVYAGIFSSSDSGTAAATGDFRAISGFAFKARNAANTADGSILSTDALDKTAVGSQTITVANNAVAPISAGQFLRGLLVVSTHQPSTALFDVLGTGQSVSKMIDLQGLYSVVAGTAGKINVYWSAGNARYEIENKSGGSLNVTIVLVGVNG